VQSTSVSKTGPAGIAESSHEVGDKTQAATAAKVNELPWIVSNPSPEYPREARRKGWIGRVGVHVLISDKGTVQQVDVLSSSGHAELDEAALAALWKWTFHPAQKDGHAVAAWVVVPVLFRLG
jgi:protein TonB